MQRKRQSLAELAAGLEKLPQVLINVRVDKRYDPVQVPGWPRRWRGSRAASATRVAWCCAPRAPSR